MAAPKTPMTAEHKAALAKGREEGRLVRAYLEALEAHRPKRGRPRTPESLRQRLARVVADIPDAPPLDRVQLIQERIDLEAEIAALENSADPAAHVDGFIKAAKAYSERKGITKAAWRELGVPADVLARAGIT